MFNHKQFKKELNGTITEWPHSSTEIQKVWKEIYVNGLTRPAHLLLNAHDGLVFPVN